MKKRTAVLMAMLGPLLISCVTQFGETHYFQSKDKKTGQVSNYYRLTVGGYAAMTSARYVSGFYDERAVDMFFNEMKIAATPASSQTTGAIFKDGINDPGTDEKITPLSPSTENGAFVMILSSNASSVTNTIGQFAESQIVADAVTNLANRDIIIAEEQLGQAEVLSAKATAAELSGLFSLIDQTPPQNGTEGKKSYLRILNSIARGVDLEHKEFSSFGDAQAWLDKEKRGKR